MKIKFLDCKKNFIAKASNKYNVNSRSFMCLQYKYLLLVLTFLLATTISKSAFAVSNPASTVSKPTSAVSKPASTVSKPASAVSKPASAVSKPASSVSLGLQTPVWMSLSSKKIEQQGDTPGLGIYFRFPIDPTAISIGYEYYSPKIRDKDLYKTKQFFRVSGVTSDGNINYNLLNVLVKVPIPKVIVRLGGGIGLGYLSDIGLSDAKVTSNDGYTRSVKDNKYKLAFLYDFAIDIGVPISTNSSINFGYRSINGTFKLEHDYDDDGDGDDDNIDANASVLNVGITVGY